MVLVAHYRYFLFTLFSFFILVIKVFPILLLFFVLIVVISAEGEFRIKEEFLVIHLHSLINSPTVFDTLNKARKEGI
jgi:hypothetical protein